MDPDASSDTTNGSSPSTAYAIISVPSRHLKRRSPEPASHSGTSCSTSHSKASTLTLRSVRTPNFGRFSGAVNPQKRDGYTRVIRKFPAIQSLTFALLF